MSELALHILEPDAYLSDSGYSKERRRGNGALRNLLAYSPTGELLWEAEFPEQADYYYQVGSGGPLGALAFSSYRCHIDPGSGRIARRVHEMTKCWEAIRGFASPGEFDRFVGYLREQIASDKAEEVPADPSCSPGELYGGRWYRSVATGEVWRLVPPDPPLTGLWEQLR